MGIFQFGIDCCCVDSGPFDFYIDVNRDPLPPVYDSEIFYKYPWIRPYGTSADYDSTESSPAYTIDMNSEADAGLYEGTVRLTLAGNSAAFDRVWSILTIEDHPDSGASPDNLLAPWPTLTYWTESADAWIVGHDITLLATATDADVTVYDSITLTAGDYELIIRVTEKEINWLRVHGSGGLDPAFSCYVEAEDEGVSAPTIGTVSNCTATVEARDDGTYYVRILFTAAGGSSGQINLTAASADTDATYTGTTDDAITVHYVFLRKLTGTSTEWEAISVVNARDETDLAFYMPRLIEFINDDPWSPLADYWEDEAYNGLYYDPEQYAGFSNRQQLLMAADSASNFGGLPDGVDTDEEFGGLRNIPRVRGNNLLNVVAASATGEKFAVLSLTNFLPDTTTTPEYLSLVEVTAEWNVIDSVPVVEEWGFQNYSLWGEVEWNLSSLDYRPGDPTEASGGTVYFNYGTVTHVPLHPVWIAPPRSWPSVIVIKQPKWDYSNSTTPASVDDDGTSGPSQWFQRSLTETVGVYIGTVDKTDRTIGMSFETGSGRAEYSDTFPMLSGNTSTAIFEQTVTLDRLFFQAVEDGGFQTSSPLQAKINGGGTWERGTYNCWCFAIFADIHSTSVGAAIVGYGYIENIVLVGNGIILDPEITWEGKGSQLPWGYWMDDFWSSDPLTDNPNETYDRRTFITVRVNGATLLDEETWRDEDYGYGIAGYGSGYGWATGMHACKSPAGNIPGHPPQFMFAWFEQLWTTEPTSEAAGEPGPWRLHLTSSAGTDWWYLDSLPYDYDIPTPCPRIVASSDQGIYIKDFLLWDDRLADGAGFYAKNWFLSYQKNEDQKPKYCGTQGNWDAADLSEVVQEDGNISEQQSHFWDCVKNSAKVRLSPLAADFGIRTTTLYVP